MQSNIDRPAREVCRNFAGELIRVDDRGQNQILAAEITENTEGRKIGDSRFEI